jgi:anhydro-N-acetylmuramic acid kinase
MVVEAVSMTNRAAIGLMSGTSMDGVDAAVLVTDGETIAGFGPRHFRAYTPGERDVLRAALADARGLADRRARPGALAEAERIVTDAHVDAVERLLQDGGLRPANGAGEGRAAGGGSVDLIGFHGQTVFHAPERRLTVQIGDGAALAKRVGIPVVHDFRAADVAAGGQGAPFVPAYHRALAHRSGLAGDIAVVNIGGVANVTRIGRNGALAAGDTGPGNALIDDFIRGRTGAAMDTNGQSAARGTVNALALAELLADPWFDLPFPKSLDRDAFSTAAVARLATDDGAATLAAFTARTIAKGIAIAGGAERIVVAGGGAHNPRLLALLAEAAATPLVTADELGWSADFLEAEAFAFLALRSLAGLPLSYPETTGVPRPMTGGVVAYP